MCFIFHVDLTASFSQCWERFKRPTVVPKKKEGPLQTSELRKTLMYLGYCQGGFCLTFGACSEITCGASVAACCAAQEEGSAHLAQPGTSPATSGCSALLIFNTHPLLCLCCPLIVSMTPRCPQEYLTKPKIPPKSLYTLKKTLVSLP